MPMKGIDHCLFNFRHRVGEAGGLPPTVRSVCTCVTCRRFAPCCWLEADVVRGRRDMSIPSYPCTASRSWVHGIATTH